METIDTQTLETRETMATLQTFETIVITTMDTTMETTMETMNNYHGTNGKLPRKWSTQDHAPRQRSPSLQQIPVAFGDLGNTIGFLDELDVSVICQGWRTAFA